MIHQGGIRLGVEQQTPRMAQSKCLDRSDGRSCQCRGTRRQWKCVAVPVQRRGHGRERAGDGVAWVGHLHGEPADLGADARRHRRSGGPRDQLCPQADSEHRQVRSERRSDPCHLGVQSGVQPAIVGTHRTPHDHGAAQVTRRRQRDRRGQCIHGMHRHVWECIENPCGPSQGTCVRTRSGRSDGIGTPCRISPPLFLLNGLCGRIIGPPAPSLRGGAPCVGESAPP